MELARRRLRVSDSMDGYAMVLAAFGDAAFKFWLGKFAFQCLLREAAAAPPGGRTGPAGRAGLPPQERWRYGAQLGVRGGGPGGPAD